jgi:threonine synthase
MRYVSTRNNHQPVTASRAIALGMVPEGGLFVPEQVPLLDFMPVGGESYQAVAERILSPFLSDFLTIDLSSCISRAYNKASFDINEIVNVVPLDEHRSVMELWHGPTAAFKDIALQIMPYLMSASKKNLDDHSHTVILVATSGDTGKAALEGFKNREGISIIVFYPHGGVSEIQKRQMTTTDGNNTYVVAVKGNFDECQTEVKRLLGSQELRDRYLSRGIEFSSANSINWGRLCPQIVYYFSSYGKLVDLKVIKAGEAVNFCVPTGNFGNILAGYYAMRLGLPIAKLICASNRNNVLADFFATGHYNSNRTFLPTMSPSMDILISSNIERFLFEVNGHDAEPVAGWSQSLAHTGAFTVSPVTKKYMDQFIVSGWVDEQKVLTTIGKEFKRSGYVFDTHTAVAAAVGREIPPNNRHTIIASTASPFKFGTYVLRGMTGEIVEDEYHAINRISALSGLRVPQALAELWQRSERHTRVIEKKWMQETLLELMREIAGEF